MKTAIIISYWKRLYNLENLILDFNNQTYKNFDLFIWNNNSDPIYKKTLNESKVKAVGYNMYVHNNNKNIFGFGRFVFANRILNNKVEGVDGKNYDNIMFFDDDERFSNNCLEFFYSQYEKNSYKGHWAFSIENSYKDRKKCKNGVEADYIGTGGAVIDPTIFLDDLFLISVPEKFYPVEDIPLTLFCKKLGYKVVGLGKITPDYLSFIKDKEGLFRKLGYGLKIEAYEFFKERYGV